MLYISKLENILKNMKVSLDIKEKRAKFLCNIKPSEMWTVSSKRKDDTALICFYRNMLKILWTERVIDKEVLRKM